MLFSLLAVDLYGKLVLPDDRGVLVSNVVRAQLEDSARNARKARPPRLARQPALRTAVEADRALAEGRRKYFEAMGYQRVGGHKAAEPLFFRTIEVLSGFIDHAPKDSRVPEALYLLGASYYYVSHGRDHAAERLLNLCSDYYRGTVWGNRADALRAHLSRGDT
ncbi:MAG: hypothetical protein NDJ90_05800 [Oligoflexia bacterium]|nr:hypothetical protein [Oligoflexia bacterium]